MQDLPALLSWVLSQAKAFEERKSQICVKFPIKYWQKVYKSPRDMCCIVFNVNKKVAQNSDVVFTE